MFGTQKSAMPLLFSNFDFLTSITLFCSNMALRTFESAN